MLKAGLCVALVAVAGSGRAAPDYEERDGPFVAEPPVSDDIKVEHLNAIPWDEAPPPPRLHGHWAQTRARVHTERVERCACGAIRIRGLAWMPERQPRVRGWF
jgi:hypothetical protein